MTSTKKSPKSTKIYRYTVFLEPLIEGGYNVTIPALPEICTFGENLKEAKAMAADAIRCFLESAEELGEEIPEDTPMTREPVKTKVAVALS